MFAVPYKGLNKNMQSYESVSIHYIRLQKSCNKHTANSGKAQLRNCVWTKEGMQAEVGRKGGVLQARPTSP